MRSKEQLTKIIKTALTQDKTIRIDGLLTIQIIQIELLLDIRELLINLEKEGSNT